MCVKTGEFDRPMGERGKKSEKMTYRTKGSRWGYRPESTKVILQTGNIKNFHRKAKKL